MGNPSLNHRYRKGFYSLFKTLQQNHEILGIFQQQGEPIQVKDAQQILTSLDCFLIQSEKKQVKALYHIFIEKITFDPNQK
ncbi:hypothetical protein OHE38_13325 [Enterococcus faecium]|nr:hypothetical protein [Enterococcus faecium]